jgi:hypothetical protein
MSAIKHSVATVRGLPLRHERYQAFSRNGTGRYVVCTVAPVAEEGP